jgi:hypothetical protein
VINLKVLGLPWLLSARRLNARRLNARRLSAASERKTSVPPRHAKRWEFSKGRKKLRLPQKPSGKGERNRPLLMQHQRLRKRGLIFTKLNQLLTPLLADRRLNL